MQTCGALTWPLCVLSALRLRPGVSLRTVGLATEHRPAGCVATGTVSLRSTREQSLSVGAKGERPPDRASRPARRSRWRRGGTASVRRTGFT